MTESATKLKYWTSYLHVHILGKNNSAGTCSKNVIAS